MRKNFPDIEHGIKGLIIHSSIITQNYLKENDSTFLWISK